jgi:hypothetical protein
MACLSSHHWRHTTQGSPGLRGLSAGTAAVAAAGTAVAAAGTAAGTAAVAAGTAVAGVPLHGSHSQGAQALLPGTGGLLQSLHSRMVPGQSVLRDPVLPAGSLLAC